MTFGQAFIGLGAYAVGILAKHGIRESCTPSFRRLRPHRRSNTCSRPISLRTQRIRNSSRATPYGGDDGLTIASRNTVAGMRLLDQPLAFYYLAFGCLLATFLLCRAPVASRFGRVLRGAKENPVGMTTLGFEVYRFQLVPVTAVVITWSPRL